MVSSRVDGRKAPSALPVGVHDSLALTDLLTDLTRSGQIVIGPAPVVSRADRSKAFLTLLAAAQRAQPPRSKYQAFTLVNAAMNAVEDRYSGVIWHEGMPLDRDCGRMLPLTHDLWACKIARWEVQPAATDILIRDADVYETKANFVLLAENGAFELWLSPPPPQDGERSARCLLRCPGTDGLTITRSIQLGASDHLLPPRVDAASQRR